jgi:hypothetical protein
MHRAQILLDPQQHKALREIAERQGRSVSSLVRDMINEQLDRMKQEQDSRMRRHMAVLDSVRDHRNALLEKRNGRALAIDIAKLIEENRSERNGKIVETGRPSGD